MPACHRCATPQRLAQPPWRGQSPRSTSPRSQQSTRHLGRRCNSWDCLAMCFAGLQSVVWSRGAHQGRCRALASLEGAAAHRRKLLSANATAGTEVGGQLPRAQGYPRPPPTPAFARPPQCSLARITPTTASPDELSGLSVMSSISGSCDASWSGVVGCGPRLPLTVRACPIFSDGA